MSLRFTHDVMWISSLFLLQLNNIPLLGYNRSCLSFHQISDFWVVSTFWLLHEEPCCEYLYTSFCVNICFLLWQINLVRLLGKTVISWLTLWGTAILFSRMAVPFDISSSNAGWFQSLHIFANTCYCLSFLLEPLQWVWSGISFMFWSDFSND